MNSQACTNLQRIVLLGETVQVLGEMEGRGHLTADTDSSIIRAFLFYCVPYFRLKVGILDPLVHIEHKQPLTFKPPILTTRAQTQTY